MLETQERESRPADNGTATRNNAGQAIPSLPPVVASRLADTLPELTTAEVYAVIRGRLAAHVITKDAVGRFACRPYVNLTAADKAVTRARAAGKAATVVMVRQDVAPLIGRGVTS